MVLSVLTGLYGGSMTYEINGINGRYDGVINDNSVRYGRNAADNHKKLVLSMVESGLSGEPPMLDLIPSKNGFDNNIKKMHAFADENDTYLKSLPPLEYEYRYMPKVNNGNIDKKALFGAAIEEMGTTSIPVKDFEKKFLPSDEYTIRPLDLNNDGNIDIAEYSTSMLAADMLSKPNPNISKIDGTINSKGMNAVMEYAHKSNADAATKLYSKIYTTHKLDELA